MLLGREPHAVHRLGECFRVELADLLGHRLDVVHRGVALEPVVVRLVLVLLLEPRREVLDERVGRIRSQADMRDCAIRRVAGKLDHLLAGEHRLADDRLVVALLAQLAQRAGRLLFVAVDEERIGIRLPRLQHRRRKIHLPGIGRDIRQHLDAEGLDRLREDIAAALAEVVVDPDHRHGPRLHRVADIARHLRHGGGLGERGAKNVGVALLRDRRGFAAGEIRDLRAPRLRHAHQDRTGEHRSHHDVSALVDRPHRERFRHLRLRLRVARSVFDLAAKDAAGGVDLLHRQLDAVIEVGAGRRAGARELHQAVDFHRLAVRGQRHAAKHQRRGGACHPPLHAIALR